MATVVMKCCGGLWFTSKITSSFTSIFTMGTIKKTKGRYGCTYRAEICVKRVRKSKTFDLRSEAMRWIEETEHLLRTGQPLPGEIPKGDIDFIEAIDKYTAAAGIKKKKNSQRLDLQSCNRLAKRFTGKTLKEITRQEIADYRDLRLKTVGPSSVLQDLSFLSSVFETARLEWQLEIANPTKDVKKPTPPQNRNILLSIDEINSLLASCKASKNKMLHSYVLLQLQTGMRPSEGAGLRWDQVLLEAKVLDLTETKTHPRRVPLNPLAISSLEKLAKNKEKNNPWVFLPKEIKPRAVVSDFFRRAFNTAVKRAGIQHVTMYGLRHCAASYLLINGVDIRFVAEILGHKNISQTMRYTHFLDSHKVAQVSVLEGIIRPEQE